MYIVKFMNIHWLSKMLDDGVHIHSVDSKKH